MQDLRTTNMFRRLYTTENRVCKKLNYYVRSNLIEKLLILFFDSRAGGGSVAEQKLRCWKRGFNRVIAWRIWDMRG